MNPGEPRTDTKRWKQKANWLLVGFLGIAAYFLIAEHRAHLTGLLYYLPFLFLLACPLMHMFMHGGHGGHGGNGGNGDERQQETQPVRHDHGTEGKQDATTIHQHNHKEIRHV